MIRRDRRGGSLVEFSAIMPVFVTMFLGIIDTGSFLWQRLALEFATQSACRAGAMVDPGVGGANAAAVYSRVDAALPVAFARYAVDCADCEADATIVVDAVTSVTSLQCTGSRTATTVTGLIPSVAIEGTVLLRLEYQR